MISDTEIEYAVNVGDIYISDFTKEQLNPNSYDVTLGNHFYAMRSDRREFDRRNPEKNYKYVYVDDMPFKFHPGCFVLAHTVEFIGAVQNYVPHLETKSTPARCGLQIHLAAGFGDVGYYNRWTMEIVNLGKRTVNVWPGERVAQVAWTRTGPVRNKYEGKYVQTGFSNWKPENMLPKWELPTFRIEEDDDENGES